MWWFAARVLRFMDTGRASSPGRSEEPIRSELFSAERMESHAESLAGAQAVSEQAWPGRSDLPARAADNDRVLSSSYHLIAEAARENRAITPAAEWLLDNFHVVEDQVREIERGLTARYCRTLPALSGGPLAGYPRAAGLVWAFVAHTDSRFDVALLARFVKAYQRVAVLSIREVWAVPLMLRWILLENLRRLAVRVATSQADRLQADTFADELLALGAQSKLTDAAAGRTLAERKLSPAFAVQLIQRLRYQDVSLQWLNERLAALGMDAGAMVQSEHARQSSANLTVRNIITSMRAIAAYDWPDWFEEVSVVDECLRANAGFAAMDFTTRDRYRHALEELAAGSGLSELEVARTVIARAALRGANVVPPDERHSDPGYYLISTGRLEFEREIGYRPPLRKRLLRSHVEHAATVYFGGIALATLALLAWPLSASVDSGLPFGGLVLLGLLGLIPASDVAMILVNRVVTLWIGPRHLPRLQFADGIPAAMRTFVVVPTLLASGRSIAAQVRRIEAHYLSNSAGDVMFAMLSDWTDAATESHPDDTVLLNAALAGMAALNARYGPTAAGEQRFHLFHRRRRWNASQRKWIGWERKRGKLHEFNRLLRGARDTSFLVLEEGQAPAPAGVRYVITLDADTRLPIDAVRRLVGTAAHPLNRPRYDADLHRVVEGYGLFQPRITPTLPSTSESSVFQRIYSGAGGLDPYAGAVSDVYQDLFGEGSFAGKGIYDVDAFEASLDGRIPENSILSHDLFEGSFVRCGLVSDLDVFEEFPSHSEVAAVRLHRWTRGDWQLLPWILGRRRRSVPALGRWKMADNLRRSLSPPATLATLLASWCMAYAPHGAWIAFVLFALSFPSLMMLVSGLLPPHSGISLRHHLRAVADDVLVACGHAVVALTLLANQAWLMLDAIVRTLYRLAISRRCLLEWVTAAQAKDLAGFAIGNFLWPLRGATVIAIGATALVLWLNPAGLAIAAPFIVLWWGSPIIARLVSLPPDEPAAKPLEPFERDLLRLAARRIWRFFETFVGPPDHWLPPDNFQETPQPVVAHRSSPTNFGLYLLSVVAARDCGWIGVGDMTRRLEDTMRTLHSMARYRGHFYNWYDTGDLRPLDPLYVSSVDSGNLAGHLLALAQACADQVRRPLCSAGDFAGIRDTVLVLQKSLARVPDDKRTLTVGAGQVYESLREVESLLDGVPQDADEWPQHWRQLQARAVVLLDVAQTFADERGDAPVSEILAWARALHADIASQVRDLALFEACAGSSDVQAGGLPALAQIPSRCRMRIDALRKEREGMPALDDASIHRLQECEREAEALLARIAAIADAARAMFAAMDFRFLFDPERALFSIGYRVADSSLDTGYYDLLASESRLTSLIAIAKGDISVTHWFRLGRALTPLGNGAALLSWSGSMFEYLMPSLVMYTPRYSLLDQTCRLAVVRQIEYGGERNVPWGVSESAYSGRDRAYTYQYSAFGVPGLGLKRGLEEELVIAPYATLLASMYDERAALKNLAVLESMGGLGAYGYYEAIDFTPSRLPENGRPEVVQAYMAHHQGMSLVALDNVLHDGIMRHRFHREPLVQAAELLLQERTPREVPARGVRSERVRTNYVKPSVALVTRRFNSPRLHIPSSHLLSNGTYAVMVTASGSGYSKWGDLAVSRWREDPTIDAWGSYLYLRDTANGKVWSATYQPTCVEPDGYEAVFLEDRARIERRDGTLCTALEILVSPEDNAEIRRLSITNNGPRERELEITSYCEVVLAPPAADSAHPAFSNLFVATEYLPDVAGLIAMRRPRKSTDAALWAAHVVAAETPGAIEYESDRARFLGRGRGVRAPVAVLDGRPLSNTVGPVLDPVFCLRQRVRIAPGATAQLAFATMAAATREEIVVLADKYHDPAIFERISSLAWTQAQVALRHLGIAPDEAHLFQYLANRILFSDPQMRPPAEVLRRNALSVRALWRHRISGDRPIVLLRVDDVEQRAIVWQVLRAHEYWRSKRLAVDLVIINERKASYSQDLQQFLEAMVSGSRGSTHAPEHGGIYVLRGDLIEAADVDLLSCAARVSLSARAGSLAEQVKRMRLTHLSAESPPAMDAVAGAGAGAHVAPVVPQLEFFNGLGGFAEGGSEYVIVLGPGQRTPAPWINVIANRQLGFQVSESGAGYTWCMNSRENQLTPWSNDPVSDPCGEALYIRDEDSGEVWSPTAAPARVESARYVARHGYGYSRFSSGVNGIAGDLLQLVAWDDPVKISSLTLENKTPRTRRLRVTAYAEWVLGASRAANAPFVVTDVDPVSNAMFARNAWNHEFAGRVAFADIGGDQSGWTTDRTAFFGRNGNRADPAALSADLDRRTGPGTDPCVALQKSLVLEPGQRVRLKFLIGQGDDAAHARDLVTRYRTADPEDVLALVRANWETILGKLQVRTPERAMDLMLNGWLLYQTLACRIWARAAFYQAGGAFGFRDQLQDSMALGLARPDLAREQLLRAAMRQFVEGDVQHWWHPPSGRGVRTHFSDDLLWLPYVAAQYVSVSGDHEVLGEMLPFLDGPELPQEQEDAYFEPAESAERGTLFEHCARAIDRSLKTGAHGLPLMGTGDWNDGMNRVGHEGRGESVWLAWFLHSTISRFAPLARQRGETERAEGWLRHAQALKTAAESEAWDGAWYRRAYFDDGTPLGSASQPECRIDSLAQSWGAISGAGDAARVAKAMQSVDEYLVRSGDDQILLFTPPFDRTPLDPGYIKGYLPGLRENGGQYTHAAVWCVIAHAMLGNGNRAGELFDMLNPVNHASSRAGVHAYKIEPYVIAADIYAEPPHVRRGGWSWYTGAAGWMYRAGVEWMLGIRKAGGSLVFDPCIPQHWKSFEATYRHGSATYEIQVVNPRGVSRGVAGIDIDGRPVPSQSGIELRDDGAVHRVSVVMGDPGQD